MPPLSVIEHYDWKTGSGLVRIAHVGIRDLSAMTDETSSKSILYRWCISVVCFRHQDLFMAMRSDYA
jgi:hypothetical protein